MPDRVSDQFPPTRDSSPQSIYHPAEPSKTNESLSVQLAAGIFVILRPLLRSVEYDIGNRNRPEADLQQRQPTDLLIRFMLALDEAVRPL